jgi:hypothetical protein
MRTEGRSDTQTDRQIDRQTDRHDETSGHFSQFCEMLLKVLNSARSGSSYVSVWVSEQSAIISLYRIITEKEKFYCALRSESSNAIQVIASLGRRKVGFIMLKCR